MVARDNASKVLAWRQRRVEFIQDPEIAEALAAREAILLARELRLQHICIEGDCGNIINYLASSCVICSPAGVIVEDIKDLII